MPLEPCTGWPDRFDIAPSHGADMVVPGGETLAWHLTLHLGRTHPAMEEIVARPLDYAFPNQV